MSTDPVDFVTLLAQERARQDAIRKEQDAALARVKAECDAERAREQSVYA